jgi:hypothetical protein
MPALDLLVLAPSPEKALQKFFGQTPKPGVPGLLLNAIKDIGVNRNAVKQMMTIHY